MNSINSIIKRLSNYINILFVLELIGLMKHVGNKRLKNLSLGLFIPVRWDSYAHIFFPCHYLSSTFVSLKHFSHVCHICIKTHHNSVF